MSIKTVYSKTSINPFFNFERKPLNATVDDNIININKDVIINIDNLQPVGVVSKGYELVKNEDISNIFLDTFNSYKIESIQDFIYKNGESWKRRIIFGDDELNFQVLPNDYCGIMVEIFNSYNGKSSWGAGIYMYRWICENGMVMGKRNLMEMKFHHLKDNFDIIKKNFQFSRDNIAFNIIPKWISWTKEPFTLKDMDRFISSREYLSDKAQEKTLLKYEEIMNKEGHSETKWGAFNTLTYIMTHETDTRKNNSDYIFSRAYKTYEKLSQDFYTI
jgi:hypothetical protein